MKGDFYYFYKYGLETEIPPCLIFLGIGALTDFTPLLARPVTFLLGAGRNLVLFLCSSQICLACIKEAASIAIIGERL